MVKICEVCGHVEESQTEAEMTYEIMNVCPNCMEHLIHETPE